MLEKKISQLIQSIYPLPKKSEEKILVLLKFEQLPKSIHLIEKGKRNKFEYFVLEGICKSYLLNPEGEEVTLSFFTSNSIVSPYTTRTDGDMSILNVKSLTEMTVAMIDARAFESLMIDDLEIRNFGNAVLRMELMSKIQKEIGMASLLAKDRLIALREKMPFLENEISHVDIASYLGITNISLSRLRKGLME